MNTQRKSPMKYTTMLVSVICFGFFSQVFANEKVVFDFESGDPQGWKIIEGKFDRFVSDRTTFQHGRGEKHNKQGKYFLSTAEKRAGQPLDDRMTGVAESPVFVLTAPKISFWVGGGLGGGVRIHRRKAYAALCTLDGREAMRAQGHANTDKMKRIDWNVPKLVGNKVFIKLVDKDTDDYGRVTFDDFRAQGKIDPDATRTREAQMNDRYVKELLKNCSGLRKTIECMSKTYGDRYPKAPQFLKALGQLEETATGATFRNGENIRMKVENLKRDALMANPLLTDQPIVYISRPKYLYGNHHAIDTHQHTDENNTKKFRPGGALKVIHFGKDSAVKTLVEPEKGMVREPDIHFGGKKIVFSMRRDIKEDFHIWEIEVDPETVMEKGASKPRQLTCLEEVSDIDPMYLPDDGVVFTSTRERKYNMCSRDVAGNLFRMESDGANIIQITKNTLYDNHATLLPDGRILYARWEYVDRNFGDAHGIWTVNPDGTGQAIYWGNNTASPGAVFNHRIIPGTGKMLCIFGPHHNWLWGSMAIVDRSKGIDVSGGNKDSVLRIWPAEHMKHVGNSGYDFFGMSTFPRYCDPYPLSDAYFLCSKQVKHKARPVEMFLVDVFGNEILLHSEAENGKGCYNAMPLSPRRRPPVIPSRRSYSNENGKVFIQDVHIGTHMKGVNRGSIKYLRVVESPPKKSWSWGNWGGQGYQAPGMNWHSFENKRILGTVPVEEDGSAFLEVPCDKFIYFQVLDENGMMVQSMRSGTVLQSGENVSCVGCHEDRLQPPSKERIGLAIKRAPSKLNGWYGPARNFSYMKEVQPVFDKNCVKCHDFGKDAGKTLVLAGDRNESFNASYVELWRWDKRRIKCIGGGPAELQQAYSWGSHPSLVSKVIRPMSDEQVTKLDKKTKALREKHKKIKLSKEELDRINTWLDINAPYYPEYLTAYPDSGSGRSPLNGAHQRTISKLTGMHFGAMKTNSRRKNPDISFERPELSPRLQKVKNDLEKYKKVLAAIKEAGEQMKKKPRCDMDGFVPCETDRRRLSRYKWYESVEERFRKAICEGKKLYDKDIEKWQYER